MTHGVLDREASSSALFLVWGPPSHGPRSRVFARELGIPIENVYSTLRRGALVAPWKYFRQAVGTVWLFARRRPRLIFVQSPPSYAVIVVALWCAITRARFVVDAHSAAMQAPYWTRPAWLYRLLARKALTTIVTNDTFAERIRSWGAKALIIRDIPTEFPIGHEPVLGESFHVLVVNTFAGDEPVAAVLEAARRVPEATLHVTGNPDRGRQRLDPSRAPSNVIFTGYLPDDDYYALMAEVDAVMCLTTRDDTMQRGACEALSMGVPIITSDWPLLRDYFSDGTVHVRPDADGIEAGLHRAMREIDALRDGIGRLRQAQRQEWVDASVALATLVGG